MAAGAVQSWPQPPLPDLRPRVKPLFCNLLLQEHVLEGSTGVTPRPQPCSPPPRLAEPLVRAGAGRVAIARRGMLLLSQSCPLCWLEPSPAEAAAPQGSALPMVPWVEEGVPRPQPWAAGPGGGCSHPGLLPGPSSECSTAPGEMGTTAGPQGRGDKMTCPRLAAVMAAAELCQHEELLAEQPGDPEEEIGPFKRDSDK